MFVNVVSEKFNNLKERLWRGETLKSASVVGCVEQDCFIITLMRYSLTGLLLMSRGGAQDSLTVRAVKDITRGLPGVLGTSEIIDL